MKSAKDSLSHRSSHHFHGDEVAEPHVCHFVADSVAAFRGRPGCAGDAVVR